jgi:putative intracellular protease/amidase
MLHCLGTVHPGEGLLTILSIESKAFEVTFAGDSEYVTSAQGVSFKTDITFREAHKKLSTYDVVIVPGGGTDAILSVPTFGKNTATEPMALIKAYADIQTKNPMRERTLLSVCTGSLFVAETGILTGLGATTHPDYMIKFENLIQSVAWRDQTERCDVMEERYVVNNLRFDIGEEDDNPYIRRRSDSHASRRASNARKGSFSLKQSNTRRESNARRAQLKLGGLRVITSGGISTGLDAALYLVSALVSYESANEVARKMQYEWHKGVVCKGIDV